MAKITFRNIKGTPLTFGELDANLGEYFLSASISGTTLKLYKSGSNGTVTSTSISLPDSTGTIDTGSFAITGSNTFVGDQVFSGSFDVTGSTTFENDISVNSITVGRGGGNNLQNTALGDQTLFFNTTGGSNVAVGKNSLFYNTEGSGNTAIGHTSLDSNTTGDFNTAVGASSLRENTEAVGNTAVGYAALVTNTVGDYNTATGYLALQLNTTGFSNTAYGKQALRQNSTGFYNTGVGAEALRFNTSGSSNTAIGHLTLEDNSTGNRNTAVGKSALSKNSSGDDNTAVGSSALLNNVSSDNTAVGGATLTSNTSGARNTGIGGATMNSNSTGNDNTSIGYRSLFSNTSGSNNIAVGIEALYSNTNGGNNVAAGRRSLYLLATGSNNTAVGDWAGQYAGGGLTANVSASTSTFIGGNTRAQANGESNQTVIGYGAIGNGSNTVTIGNTSITDAHVQVDWTITSDERDKIEISPIGQGLDFVNQLNPIQYEFKSGDRDSTTGDGILRYGFSAQQVLGVEGDSPVIVNNKDPEKLKLTQAYIIPPLVKAIKELTQKVNELETRLNSGG